MGRTWLLRGVIVAVLAVLVGAWASGLAGFGDAASPPDKPNSPESPDRSKVPDIKESTIVVKAKPRRTREATTVQEALDEQSPDTVDTPADDDTPAAPDPTSDDPTPASPDPTDPSDGGTHGTPPPTVPSEPAEECTDLLSTLDCVLDPITGAP